MQNASSNISPCWCEFDGASYSSQYEIFNFVTVMVLTPTIATFGLLNNMINVYLYTRPQSLSESASVYLAALAGSDIITDFCGLIMTMDSAKAYSYYLRSNLSPFQVRLWPLGQIATTCSIYFTVGAAVDCFVKVCWTRKASAWNNLRRSCQFVFGVVSVSVFFNIPRFWELKSETCFDNTTDETRVEVCPTEFRMGYMSQQIYNVYVHMVLMMFLPFLTLIMLNAMIVFEVRRTKRLQQMIASLTASVHLVATSAGTRPPPRDVPIADEGDEDDNTLTLIMVVVLFLLCNIFNLIANVADSLLGMQQQGLNYLSDIANALTIVNASANFLIYVTFDKKYRKSFCYHILRVRLSDATPDPDMTAQRLARPTKPERFPLNRGAFRSEYNSLDTYDGNYQLPSFSFNLR